MPFYPDGRRGPGRPRKDEDPVVRESMDRARRRAEGWPELCPPAPHCAPLRIDFKAVATPEDELPLLKPKDGEVHSLPVGRSRTKKLRAKYLNCPVDELPQRVPPRRLSPQDLVDNYVFRLADEPYGLNDPIVLFERVRTGAKPMATILLRTPRVHYVMEQTVELAAKASGLACKTFFTRSGRQEAVIFQASATLGDFFDPDETVARYAQAGVAVPRDIFAVLLEHFAYHVISEEFPASVLYPMLGMCFGYPVGETIGLLQTLRLRQRA